MYLLVEKGMAHPECDEEAFYHSAIRDKKSSDGAVRDSVGQVEGEAQVKGWLVSDVTL